MKLSKEQQKELKKIDTRYSQIEELSEKAGLKLEEVVTLYNFGSSDLIEQERELLFKRNRSRQQVFEQAQTVNKKVKSSSSR